MGTMNGKTVIITGGGKGGGIGYGMRRKSWSVCTA